MKTPATDASEREVWRLVAMKLMKPIEFCFALCFLSLSNVCSYASMGHGQDNQIHCPRLMIGKCPIMLSGPTCPIYPQKVILVVHMDEQLGEKASLTSTVVEQRWNQGQAKQRVDRFYC